MLQTPRSSGPSVRKRGRAGSRQTPDLFNGVAENLILFPGLTHHLLVVSNVLKGPWARDVWAIKNESMDKW